MAKEWWASHSSEGCYFSESPSSSRHFTQRRVHLQYRPAQHSQTYFPLLTLLWTFFDGAYHFFLNTGHVDQGTLLCSALPASFDTKIVDMVQDSLMFQRVRGPSRQNSHIPSPSLLDRMLMRDDSDVYDMELNDPLGLSGHAAVRFLIDW